MTWWESQCQRRKFSLRKDKFKHALWSYEDKEKREPFGGLGYYLICVRIIFCLQFDNFTIWLLILLVGCISQPRQDYSMAEFPKTLYRDFN